ncbi:MAG: hypothetical protein NC033_06540 [Clostridiales bacterium]|nr:hypothetical protein [Clostridiales bacterium]
MIYSLMAIPAAQKTATTVFVIIAAVAVLIVLIFLLVKKIIIPIIENKKYQEDLQAKRQKEQELNKIWRANYQKINSVLKGVFYAGLVDSWKNIQDMLEYQVKDTCPYCNGKLVEGKNDWTNTKSLQYSPTGQIVNTNMRYAHLWVGEDKPDGGYISNTPTVCEKCHRTLFVKSSSSVARYDSKKEEEYWSNNESYSFAGIKWRNPNTEQALGKELCDYIDSNGHLHPETLTQTSRNQRKYN